MKFYNPSLLTQAFQLPKKVVNTGSFNRWDGKNFDHPEETTPPFGHSSWGGN